MADTQGIFEPLFIQIDRMLSEGRVILTIEGGSGSGKTTLGEMLKEIYGAAVFHMDDFFLRPEQRTRERLELPGGNVDWERFRKEVVLPLGQNERICYRPFDCCTFTLKDPVIVKPSRVTIVEGDYSMHPDLGTYYNLSVFLNISDEQQRKRIQRRNIPEKAERFFNEWIPLEQVYFEKLAVKDRCDLVIEIG